MLALDDIGWDFGFSFTSHGVKLGLRVSNIELLELLYKHLPYRCEKNDATVVDRLFSVVSKIDEKKQSVRYNLYSNEMLFGKNFSIQQLQNTFASLTSLAVAELSDEKLFIHCGVVGWQGKAVLIPGRSHDGKSTLVAQLVKLGASYYSDEFAVLDNEACISAYPRPILLRDPLTKIRRDIDIDDIGGKVGSKTLPVGIIIITKYKSGSSWKPKSISAGHGLLALLGNTHSAQRSPERAMKILTQVVSDATILSSDRGEADKTAHGILSEITSVLQHKH